MKTRYSKRLKRETPEYGLFSKKCLICLDNKHDDLFNFNPNCNHNICNICCKKWIKISEYCPLCKKSLIRFELITFEFKYDFTDTEMFFFLNYKYSPYIISFITIIFYLFAFIQNIIKSTNFEFNNEDYVPFFQEIHPNLLND